MLQRNAELREHKSYIDERLGIIEVTAAAFDNIQALFQISFVQENISLFLECFVACSVAT